MQQNRKAAHVPQGSSSGGRFLNTANDSKLRFLEYPKILGMRRLAVCLGSATYSGSRTSTGFGTLINDQQLWLPLPLRRLEQLLFPHWKRTLEAGKVAIHKARILLPPPPATARMHAFRADTAHFYWPVCICMWLFVQGAFTSARSSSKCSSVESYN